MSPSDINIYDFRQRTDIKPAARPFFYHAKTKKNIAFLVHGFSASPFELQELGKYLADNGVSARGILMAGHGGSFASLERATKEDWWKSVKEEIDIYGGEYQNIYLIGYSFGANIVIDIATRYPKLAKGIVCLGPSLFLKRAKAIKFLYHFFALYKDRANKTRMTKTRRAVFESQGRHITLPLKALKNFLDFIDHITLRQLEQFTAPVLLVHSRDDMISHPKSSEVIFERIGSEDKELFILNEFEHNPLNSRNKDIIFEKILSFVGAHQK